MFGTIAISTKLKNIPLTPFKGGIPALCAFAGMTANRSFCLDE